MDDGPPRVAIVFDGAGGEEGRAAAVRIADRAVHRGDLEADLLDLAEAALPEAADPCAGPVPCAVGDLAPWLADADAFAVVTAGDDLPAGLRDAVGWCADTWRDKPIALVVAGDRTDAVRAGALLRSLQVRPVVMTASLHGGTATDRWCEDTADRLLDHLLRWVLRPRRPRTP